MCTTERAFGLEEGKTCHRCDLSFGVSLCFSDFQRCFHSVRNTSYNFKPDTIYNSESHANSNSYPEPESDHSSCRLLRSEVK